MRRSSSCTRIPLFRRENSSSRARSTERINRENSSGSIPRNRSTDRPRLNSISTRVTATPNFSTPVSRLPPYSGGSATISRPVNDPKWVSEQAMKVREFLLSHENCDAEVANKLKSLTINTFVYIIGFLVREIDPHVDINMINYKEVLLPLLKSFRYPGTVSMSLLKTVNTKHAWPQVIGILSWLVDLINALKPKHHTMLTDQINDHLIQYMAKRYHKYNYGEDTTELDQEHIETLFKILDFDLEKVAELKKIELELETQKQSQLQQLSEKEEQQSMIRDDIERMQQEIEAFYREEEVKQEQIANQMKGLEEQIPVLEEKFNSIDENIKKLRETLKNQSCTLKEKAELLQQIEENKHTIALKQERNNKWLEIKSKLDLQVVELKQQAEDKMSRFNDSLMEIALIYPGLKILTLADSGFHRQSYKDELRRVNENIERLEKEISEKIAKTKDSINKLETEKEALIKSNKKGTEDLVELLAIEKIIVNEIESYREQHKAIVKNFHEEEQALSNLLEQFAQSEPDIESLRAEIEEYKEIEKQKARELDEKGANAINVFVQLYNSSLIRLKDMEACRQSILNKQASYLEAVKQQQAEILEALKKLEELKKLEFYCR